MKLTIKALIFSAMILVSAVANADAVNVASPEGTWLIPGGGALIPMTIYAVPEGGRVIGARSNPEFLIDLTQAGSTATYEAVLVGHTLVLNDGVPAARGPTFGGWLEFSADFRSIIGSTADSGATNFRRVDKK